MKFLATTCDGWISETAILTISEEDEKDELHTVTYKVGEKILTALCLPAALRKFLT